MGLGTAEARAGLDRASARVSTYWERLATELAPGRVLRIAVIAAQFALIVAAIRLLNIETPAFESILTLALGGFLVHHYLPAAWRQGFFAALSVASVPMVFGWHDGAWLLGMGCALIALCHLPVSLRARIALLVLTGVAMAVERAQALPGAASLVPGTIWPILGSMFMFRIMLYLYDLKHRAAPFGVGRALAYFFMLPNVCFPLFPIVDYKTLQRSIYNDDALRLYQTGVRFLLRGLLHLALYKVIYFMGVIEAGEVASGLDAARYMVVAYLLYLKVSGIFHLVVGILHMYGYGMAATHHLYLLSSSFTDLWRRVNIYWRDFIQKLVFNPAYFWLRKRGEMQAIGVATTIAAVVTWLFHSYQWFWIRGDFPLGQSDIIFWTALGVGLTVNVILEARKGRSRALEKQARTLRENAVLCLKTAAMFTTIVILWTIWSTPKLEELGLVWRALLTCGPLDLAVIVGLPLSLGLYRVSFGERKREGGSADTATPAFWPEAAVVSLVATAFIVVALRPLVLVPVWPALATLVTEVRDGRLNAADLKRLQHGYYENLADVTRFNNELWMMYGGRPNDWTESKVQRSRPDAIGSEFIPSTSEVFKGAVRTINSLGMRDREYTVARAPDIFRIALVGVSNDAGTGVKDDETYENLVEDRLNRELGARTGKKFEILNFSQGGLSATQKLATIERRVFDFRPDVILYMAYSPELEWTFSSAQHLIKNQLVGEFPFVKLAMDRAGVSIDAGAMPKEKIVLESRLAPYAEDALRAVLERFRTGAAARGIRPVLVLGASLDDAGRSTEIDRLIKLGQASGMKFLNMQGAFDEVKERKSLWIAPWDTHPNAQGHRLLAARLYALLLEEGVVPTQKGE